MTAPTITVGLPERHRDAAARLYLDAFAAKLGPLLGRGDRAVAFLSTVLRPEQAIAAEDETGALIGVAGFHDHTGGFVGGQFGDLVAAYGFFGALWRTPLLAIFERAPEPGQLLMDGVVVAPEARGRGVGGALLTRIAALAEDAGQREVRLEVVDTNPRARALYERRGFRAAGEKGFALLGPLFGFRRATTMVLAV